MRAPEFWSRSGALPTLLAPLGLGYGLGTRLRRALVRPIKVPVPVICVGNLVAGGAGKTPVALACLAALKDRGLDAHALTRGYGGTAAGPLRVEPNRHKATEVGDEALLLAGAAPTWVARDRAAGAQAAVKAGAQAIVMDDGFQNPALVKDLSLLVVDGAYGFGNGRLIPAGPLRETVPAGLARADAVILLGADEAGLTARLGARHPLLRADLAPGPEAAELEGRKVVAFAGIARPEKFFRTLREAGAQLAETRGFPDHHPYGAAELRELRTRARSLDAVLITTEKDAVRLAPGQREGIETLAVAVAWDDPAALQALLDKLPVP
ncbi:MAG: tetraacyldisaccharide 4'-kinase [Kiloniellales bacterium]|jgi:tetraacyldisaccharide 4'-kinase